MWTSASPWTEEDEAAEVKQAEEALAARSALWAGAYTRSLNSAQLELFCPPYHPT